MAGSKAWILVGAVAVGLGILLFVNRANAEADPTGVGAGSGGMGAPGGDQGAGAPGGDQTYLGSMSGSGQPALTAGPGSPQAPSSPSQPSGIYGSAGATAQTFLGAIGEVLNRQIGANVYDLSIPGRVSISSGVPAGALPTAQKTLEQATFQTGLAQSAPLLSLTQGGVGVGGVGGVGSASNVPMSSSTSSTAGNMAWTSQAPKAGGQTTVAQNQVAAAVKSAVASVAPALSFTSTKKK